MQLQLLVMAIALVAVLAVIMVVAISTALHSHVTSLHVSVL